MNELKLLISLPKVGMKFARLDYWLQQILDVLIDTKPRPNENVVDTEDFIYKLCYVTNGELHKRWTNVSTQRTINMPRYTRWFYF